MWKADHWETPLCKENLTLEILVCLKDENHVSTQGLNLQLLQWKFRDLPTGPPGNSQSIFLATFVRLRSPCPISDCAFCSKAIPKLPDFQGGKKCLWGYRSCSNKAEVFQVGHVHKTPCTVRCTILLILVKAKLGSCWDVLFSEQPKAFQFSEAY